MNNDFELFKGKNLSDVFEDIYKNQKAKKKRISELIYEIKIKIRNINDWVVIGPLIRDLVDTSVRNDEALIKLATVAQRIMTANSRSEDGGALLSEEERQQLLQAVQEVADELVEEDDDIKQIEHQVDELAKKMKHDEPES